MAAMTPRNEVLFFVKYRFNLHFRKPPKHLHHPTVLLNREVYGPLQFFLIEIIPVKMVFNNDFIIKFRMLVRQIGDRFDMEIVDL